jgi:hypothetical protein
MDGHFLTLALTPYYFEGKLAVFRLGKGQGKEEVRELPPFPDPTFQYCTVHDQTRSFVTRYLKEVLGEDGKWKVKEVFDFLQERQMVLWEQTLTPQD